MSGGIPLSRERIARAARLYPSNKEAARAIGCTPGSFGRACRKFDIQTPPGAQEKCPPTTKRIILHMAIKATFHLEGEQLAKLPATMTITMTIEEWRHLNGHLLDHPHWVGNSLRGAIRQLLTKADEKYVAEETYKYE